jgi:hypothetical protein
MKMNEKFCLYFLAESHTKLMRKAKSPLVSMDDNYFIAFIFTLQAIRRLPSAALFRAKHSLL